MAECLNPTCGRHRARVTETRSIQLGTGERQNLRTVVCPPEPEGCGQRRTQVISDGGPCVKMWIPRPRLKTIALILPLGAKR